MMKLTDKDIKINLDNYEPWGGALFIKKNPNHILGWDEDDNGILWAYEDDDASEDQYVGLEVQDFNAYWSHHREELFKAIASKTGDNLEDVKRILSPYWRS